MINVSWIEQDFFSLSLRDLWRRSFNLALVLSGAHFLLFIKLTKAHGVTRVSFISLQPRLTGQKELSASESTVKIGTVIPEISQTGFFFMKVSYLVSYAFSELLLILNYNQTL